MKKYRQLELTNYSEKTEKIHNALSKMVVGQEQAITSMLDVTEKYQANLYDHSRPIGSLLFLGPTGTGKTLVTEAYCKALFNNENALIKIDCSEFQHSHEIAKLLGSPAGYLGHRETPARLTNKSLGAYYTPEYQMSVVLFDEIEKASDALWHLLLGILDKGTLTLGDNTVTSFNKSIIVMTSNVGSIEMDKAIGGGIGFLPDSIIDEKELANIAVAASKKKFTPEFLNRLDKIVPFHTLSLEQIKKITDIELERLQKDILVKTNPILFFEVSPAAKRQLIEEGFDPKYNGREIRRVIEKRIGLPLATIIAQGLVKPAETVIIDYARKFTFGVLED